MTRQAPSRQRQWLAEQAARCMSEERIDDPETALRRVLSRHGSPAPDRRQWPAAAEILHALQAYQRLFRSADQAEALQRRREAALEALGFFADFRPYLVGAALEGTADAHSPVQLHLYCGDGDTLLHFLHENGIAHRLGERRITLPGQGLVAIQHVRFTADGIDFELWLLPANAERSIPRGRDGHTPIPRANEATLRELIEAQAISPGGH